jgi:hypothetical protein
VTARGFVTVAATDVTLERPVVDAETASPPEWDVFARADYAARKSSNSNGGE